MGGFNSNSTAWLAQEARHLKRTEKVMGDVILNRSNMIAPKESGDLIADGRIVVNPSGGISVIYGDASVPYARRRHFENKRNPQTLGYLQKAGDSVAKENVKKYVDLSR